MSRYINKKDKNRYDDMLHLPHHESTKHPKMSMINRAAQFSPFAALTGYNEAVLEEARLVNQKIELSEDEVLILNKRLNLISEHIVNKPMIQITYFIEDKSKIGGEYKTIISQIKKIDEYQKKIVLIDNTTIEIKDILSIEGELFNHL